MNTTLHVRVEEVVVGAPGRLLFAGPGDQLSRSGRSPGQWLGVPRGAQPAVEESVRTALRTFLPDGAAERGALRIEVYDPRPTPKRPRTALRMRAGRARVRHAVPDLTTRARWRDDYVRARASGAAPEWMLDALWRLLDGLEGSEARRGEAEAKRATAERLLESLTPGGEAYRGNPAACASYVRARFDEDQAAIEQLESWSAEAEVRLAEARSASGQ